MLKVALGRSLVEQGADWAVKIESYRWKSQLQPRGERENW